jgi:serine/threonine protein kinase
MDHPNIMKIFQIYEEPFYYYIVCEMCPGKELYRVLCERKVLGEEEAARVFYQVVSAVSYMHSRGIMHRYLLILS